MKRITPNLYNGLGSAVYALVKIDGQLHLEESIKARMVLVEEPNGELAMQSFQLREHHQTPVEEAYNLALSCFVSNHKEFNPRIKKYFTKILKKVISSDDRISEKETEFLQRFQQDLHRL
jgi:uncharacterized tellurite resistance protein B-like protein